MPEEICGRPPASLRAVRKWRQSNEFQLPRASGGRHLPRQESTKPPRQRAKRPASLHFRIDGVSQNEESGLGP
jgi:hypothetical protein